MAFTKMNLYFSTKSNKESKKKLNTIHEGKQINKKGMSFAHLKGKKGSVGKWLMNSGPYVFVGSSCRDTFEIKAGFAYSQQGATEQSSLIINVTQWSLPGILHYGPTKPSVSGTVDTPTP